MSKINFKNKIKNIILMHLQIKNTLKSNFYCIFKHHLLFSLFIYLFILNLLKRCYILNHNLFFPAKLVFQIVFI